METKTGKISASDKEWPRRCSNTPEPGPQKGLETVDTTRVHHETYTLYRVYRDGTEEPVEGTETDDRITGIESGFRLSRTELDHGFSLYRGERRVHKFCHDRLALRLKPGSVEMLVS